MGFPIRKSPDQSSFATPRSLSQLITSFIGSWCQGIPLALFLAWPSSESASARCVSVHSLRSGRKLRLAPLFLLSNQNPLALGFWFVGERFRCFRFPTSVTSRIIHFYLVSLVELCRLIKEVSLAKIVIITLLIKKVFLYCCLLIIASIIHNVQFSRCIVELLFQETQWSF